jgi:F-type H+-transporting ATPase subunit delta
MAEAELVTVARPYARAAYSTALDQPDGLSSWSRMLVLLGAAVDNADIREALDNPAMSSQASATLLIEICGDDLNDAGRNFVRVLAEYDRILLLPSISTIFEALKAQHEKTMNVQVASAFEVTGEEASKLGEALKKMLQREINLESTVDKSLLGGVVIRAEDTVIDNSIRGRLAKLSNQLN